jgi:hypothetical protein
METATKPPRKIILKAVPAEGVEVEDGEGRVLTLNAPQGPIKMLVIRSDNVDSYDIARLSKQFREKLGEGTVVVGVDSQTQVDVYEEIA